MPMNEYHSAEEYVCYGCEGPRDVDQAGSGPGFTKYIPCPACGMIGVKRKGDPDRARVLPNGHVSLGLSFERRLSLT